MPEGVQKRLDIFIADNVPGLSRSQAQYLIKSGSILLNGSQAKAKTQVDGGQRVVIVFPEKSSELPLPEAIPLEVLFEDEDVIVVDKPHGLVVHPANGNEAGTLVNALLHHCGGKLAAVDDPLRPGIVHRLDKDTSGCLIAAKTSAAYDSLTHQFANRLTQKHYLAVCQGMLNSPSGTLKTQIGRHPVHRQKMAVLEEPAGKFAHTDFDTVAEYHSTPLVKCRIHTGRTHQIRVHLSHAGAPILGDPIYAKPSRQSLQPGRLMLHAWKLSISHPLSGEQMDFETSPPSEFQPWLDAVVDPL